MTERQCPPIGVHAFAAGGLARGALCYAAEVGAEAMQVFVSNPRSWALSPGDPGQERALRDHVAATGLPLFVHAPYLINIGSPDPLTRDRSVASLQHSLRRGAGLGARGVVVHTGSTRTSAPGRSARPRSPSCCVSRWPARSRSSSRLPARRRPRPPT